MGSVHCFPFKIRLETKTTDYHYPELQNILNYISIWTNYTVEFMNWSRYTDPVS